jgi:hypothetical protein
MGADGGYTDIFSVGRVLLSGSYVAYASTDDLGGGRYGTTGGIDVTDLLTGRSINGVVLGNFAEGLILAPPVAAWEANNAPYSWAIQAPDVRTGKTTALDSVCSFPGCIEPGPAPPRSPFANLQLQRCLAGCSPLQAIFAWWTDNGVWRSTRVG